MLQGWGVVVVGKGEDDGVSGFGQQSGFCGKRVQWVAAMITCWRAAGVCTRAVEVHQSYCFHFPSESHFPLYVPVS